MLTPKFEVQQDEAYVTVKIFAPYARITDAEISITEELFTFYSSPYYLRLTFPGKLVDSELEEHSAKFDADSGAFIIKCKKEIQGEHFPNLDLLTMLLAPQGASGVTKPSIEVLSNGSEIENEEEDIDFTFEQTLPEESIVTMGHKYGFGNNSSGVFSVLQLDEDGLLSEFSATSTGLSLSTSVGSDTDNVDVCSDAVDVVVYSDADVEADVANILWAA